MPVISMFYGIIVLMYYFDDKKHHRPHIHVEYGEEQAVISIPDGEVLEGSLRTAKLRLVEAWIEIHSEALMADWKLATSPTGVQDRSAEITAKMKRAVEVKANDDFSLDLRFTDGCVKRFDVKPYLNRGIFSELQDLDYFKQTSLAYGAVQWPNGQDISPDTLYLESVDISDPVPSFPRQPHLTGQAR